MTTFTEIVAAAVVHSSAAALSHFGVTIEPARTDHPTPAVEHVVARTPRPAEKLNGCPQLQQQYHAPALKA